MTLIDEINKINVEMLNQKKSRVHYPQKEPGSLSAKAIEQIRQRHEFRDQQKAKTLFNKIMDDFDATVLALTRQGENKKLLFEVNSETRSPHDGSEPILLEMLTKVIEQKGLKIDKREASSFNEATGRSPANGSYRYYATW